MLVPDDDEAPNFNRSACDISSFVALNAPTIGAAADADAKSSGGDFNCPLPPNFSLSRRFDFLLVGAA